MMGQEQGYVFGTRPSTTEAHQFELPRFATRCLGPKTTVRRTISGPRTNYTIPPAPPLDVQHDDAKQGDDALTNPIADVIRRREKRCANQEQGHGHHEARPEQPESKFEAYVHLIVAAQIRLHGPGSGLPIAERKS